MAELVGDFIRYWGFRKIHGEIWTIVYLSRESLSGADLVEILDVSKALVSPALKELEAEGLIFQTDSENSKTKRYVAEDDVLRVIKKVLDRREKPMIEKILGAQVRLEKDVLGLRPGLGPIVNEERFRKLRRMTEVAQMSLQMISDSELGQNLEDF